MNKLFDFIDLHQGEEEREKVLENVKANISFRGSNLWILACAIVIASIGLNVNSTAVVIGAMLISPLMGPIVGAGFALAIYDFELLKKSGKNLLIATIVGLVVASIYFFVSPFKETQSELLARTYPTIYDVMIAFFGGLVGVIAITRVEKGNPIPGVAIATALMPPLCTAGYGLAIGNFEYFWGAFYLYAINCFFICISTFLIIKYLRYKRKRFLDQQFEKKIRIIITALILIMIVPSSYLAYTLLNEKTYTQNVNRFIDDEFSKNGDVLVYKKLSYNTNPKKLELAFLSKKFTEDEIQSLNNQLKEYHIENTALIIKQNLSDLKNEILNEIGNQNKNLSEKDMIINNLKEELSAYKLDNADLDNEIRILFPEISNFSIGKISMNGETDSTKNGIVILVKTSTDTDPDKLQKWLEQKFHTQNVKVILEE